VRHAAADFGQVDVHGVHVDVRQHDSGTNAALRAGRAGQVGRGVAVATQCARARAPLGPHAGQRARARSGPCSTRPATTASCPGDRRGFGPFCRGRLAKPASPPALKRCTRSRRACRPMSGEPGEMAWPFARLGSTPQRSAASPRDCLPGRTQVPAYVVPPWRPASARPRAAGHPPTRLAAWPPPPCSPPSQTKRQSTPQKPPGRDHVPVNGQGVWY